MTVRDRVSDTPDIPPVKPRSGMWTAIRRALGGHCPQCGKGKLYRAYLKQVETCAHCKAPLGDISADDGPSWLTILVVGHIMAPILVLVTGQHSVPAWVLFLGLMGLGLGLCLTLLPKSKALFIAAIWQSKAGDASALEHDPEEA